MSRLNERARAVPTVSFTPALQRFLRVPETCEALSRGLPQRHAYDLLWRLAVDASGERLAFGSTTGGLWISADCGDSWQAIDARLPPIAVVRFA